METRSSSKRSPKLLESLENRRLMSVASLRTLAATGLSTGELPGVNFNHVFVPAINDAGQAAYFSNLLGPGYRPFDGAIWRSTVNPLNPTANPSRGLIAAFGGVAPDAAGATYLSFGNDLNVNDDGQVTFYSQLSGGDVVGSDADTAQYVGTPAAVVERFREGDQAPGAPAGVVYNDSIFGNGAARLGDGGVVGQRIDVRGEGISTFNEAGIVVGTLGGEQQLVAREADPAPNTPFGQYSFYSIGSPLTNDDGLIVFDTYLYDEATELPTSFQSIWTRSPDGVLQPAVFPGMALNDVGPGAYFGSASSPAINGAGQIAFNALFQDPQNTATDRGLFVGTAQDGYRLVARNFQPAPGLDGVAMQVSGASPLVNAQGQVVFTATLLGANAGITSQNNETVWLWSPTDRSLTLAWREGNVAPGAPEGVTFGPLLQSPAVNAEGQVLVYSQLRDSVDGNDRGIYATEADGLNIFKVVMEGDTIEVAAGDSRQVTFLEVQTGSGGEDGRRSGINDAGQVAFRALFGSASSGAFVADTLAPPVAAPVGTAGFEVDAVRPTVALDFTHSVSADFSVADAVLRNLDTNQTIVPTIEPDGAGGARLVLPTNLADGNYRLTLDASEISDAFGRALDGDANGTGGDDLTFDFFVFAGDANRDRKVDIGDFSVLASNFNQRGAFSDGDFNYSGTVEIGDFAILAGKFNAALPAARPASSTSLSDASTKRGKVFSSAAQIGLHDTEV